MEGVRENAINKAGGFSEEGGKEWDEERLAISVESRAR